MATIDSVVCQKNTYLLHLPTPRHCTSAEVVLVSNGDKTHPGDAESVAAKEMRALAQAGL